MECNGFSSHKLELVQRSIHQGSAHPEAGRRIAKREKVGDGPGIEPVSSFLPVPPQLIVPVLRSDILTIKLTAQLLNESGIALVHIPPAGEGATQMEMSTQLAGSPTTAQRDRAAGKDGSQGFRRGQASAWDDT